MSAPNYFIRNANRYFIAEEPEGETRDDFWYEDLKEDLMWTAHDNGFEVCPYNDWNKDIERKANYRDNDYYAVSLHTLYECGESDKFDGWWNVTIVPLLRSGYYANANLDFYIKLETPDGDDLENDDVFHDECLRTCVADYLYGLDNFAQGDGCEVLGMVCKLIDKAVDKFYEFAEKSGLDEYAKAYQGSNGEAGYTNLSEIKRRAQKQEQQ